MSRMFASLYGAELLQGRLGAIDYIRSLRIDYPRKYTLRFIKSARGALNYRWVQELREMTNVLRTHAQVESPAFDQLRPIGMTVVTATGLTVFQRPTAFNLSGPKGYFVTEIVRRMNEEKELKELNSYHTGGARPNKPRLGASPEAPGLPGPPMTHAERRIAGKEAPKTPAGERICWDSNSQLGCSDASCSRSHQFYRNSDQLPYTLKIALSKRYGFKKRGKLSFEQIGETIKALRNTVQREALRKRPPPGARGDLRPRTDPTQRVGGSQLPPH